MQLSTSGKDIRVEQLPSKYMKVLQNRNIISCTTEDLVSWSLLLFKIEFNVIIQKFYVPTQILLTLLIRLRKNKKFSSVIKTGITRTFNCRKGPFENRVNFLNSIITRTFSFSKQCNNAKPKIISDNWIFFWKSVNIFFCLLLDQTK